jgi:hypothetical protein
MGPLRIKTLRNTGTRGEPTLEVRVEEYNRFFHREGMLLENEKIIIGIRGKGLAIMKSLPETLTNKCQRLGTKFKINNVIIVVDMLIEVNQEDQTTARPDGYKDYMKLNNGKRAILLSSVVLPEIVDSMTRNVISFEILPVTARVNGLDVHRLLTLDINMLHEREIEIFTALE